MYWTLLMLPRYALAIATLLRATAKIDSNDDLNGNIQVIMAMAGWEEDDTASQFRLF